MPASSSRPPELGRGAAIATPSPTISPSGTATGAGTGTSVRVASGDEPALIRHGELGRPHAHDIAEAQDTDTLDALAVDVGAVRGAEVLDRQHAARAARHPGVAARELGVLAQPPVDVGGGTPDQQLTVDGEPRARCLPGDHAQSLVRHGRATLRLPVRGHHPSVTRMIVLPGTRGASGPNAEGASGKRPHGPDVNGQASRPGAAERSRRAASDRARRRRRPPARPPAGSAAARRW